MLVGYLWVFGVWFRLLWLVDGGWVFSSFALLCGFCWLGVWVCFGFCVMVVLWFAVLAGLLWLFSLVLGWVGWLIWLLGYWFGVLLFGCYFLIVGL